MSCWVGIIVSRNDLRLVRIDLGDGAVAAVTDDRSLKLQSGPRPQAYRKAEEWLSTYLSENRPAGVAIKGSALPGRGGATLGLLEGAEFRGAVMGCAVEAGCSVFVSKKAALSKTFGDRKIDAYLGDEGFWAENFEGKLRKGSREAALVAYAAAKGNNAA